MRGNATKAKAFRWRADITVMKIEMFDDGSSIETDETTGNRTVIGELAHKEYFKRLAEERFNKSTPRAVVAFCMDADGTRKAELIRRTITNPLTREWLGEYGWETWTRNQPDVVTRHYSEAEARLVFRSLSLEGTNV